MNSSCPRNAANRERIPLPRRGCGLSTLGVESPRNRRSDGASGSLVKGSAVHGLQYTKTEVRMPRLRRFPILVFALVLAASCSPGTSGPIPGPVCGDPPELGYVCPDGVAPACACETHEDGTVQWHCAQCGAIDCASNPNDPVCKADQSCIRCHGLASSEAGTGIENAHPWSYLGCVDCHGGAGVDLANPTRLLTIEESHVHIPHDIAQSGSVTTADRTAYANYYLARPGVENLTRARDWLRSSNPP